MTIPPEQLWHELNLSGITVAQIAAAAGLTRNQAVWRLKKYRTEHNLPSRWHLSGYCNNNPELAERHKYLQAMLIEVRADGTKVYKPGPALGYGLSDDADDTI